MKNKNGFTLLELLVVGLIIGILAAVALPQYKTATMRAKATEALIIGKHIKELEETYYLIHRKYTDNFYDLEGNFPGKINKDGTKLTLNSGFLVRLLVNYPRVLLSYPASQRVNISFNLARQNSTSHRPNSISCTAYSADHYKWTKTCQHITGNFSAGAEGCGHTCRSWSFKTRN